MYDRIATKHEGHKGFCATAAAVEFGSRCVALTGSGDAK